MSLIIAICGMAGAGKSTVRQMFEEAGYQNIHLGVTEECMRRYGSCTEEQERALRVELRKEHGMAAMIVIALPTIEELLSKGQKIVIDNLYSWSEYKLLKEKYPENFITIAVHASPAIRYERLKVRSERPRDEATSRSRDYAEIEEIEKGGPIAMADYHLINEHNDREINKEFDVVINHINETYK
jgi:dephospho-CoA kinase